MLRPDIIADLSIGLLLPDIGHGVVNQAAALLFIQYRVAGVLERFQASAIRTQHLAKPQSAVFGALCPNHIRLLPIL